MPDLSNTPIEKFIRWEVHFQNVNLGGLKGFDMTVIAPNDEEIARALYAFRFPFEKIVSITKAKDQWRDLFPGILAAQKITYLK